MIQLICTCSLSKCAPSSQLICWALSLHTSGLWIQILGASEVLFVDMVQGMVFKAIRPLMTYDNWINIGIKTGLVNCTSIYYWNTIENTHETRKFDLYQCCKSFLILLAILTTMKHVLCFASASFKIFVPNKCLREIDTLFQIQEVLTLFFVSLMWSWNNLWQMLCDKTFVSVLFITRWVLLFCDATLFLSINRQYWL